ncbi:helix-turn-helix transcriptional regulator [Chenggangzhangella methanolivorans]|uniref:helix-turn-helix transcriptional regulator n=1 Tax=Chenggangzhangella methanolivorans TaxID=1437009 RepID=UPI00361A7961
MSDIVERIYEAAALPELWPDLFQDLSNRYEFVGAGMFCVNAQFQRGISSPGIADVLERFLTGGWQDRNCRAPRTAKLNYEGFVRDQDILTDEEIENEPMYAELLRPAGLGYGAGSVIKCPSDDLVAFSFERAGKLGPTPVEILGELDKLRPHLARASIFSARIDLERSRAQVEALSALGLPAAVTRANGSTLAANAAFEALAAQIKIGARDGLRLSDPAADALLREAFARDGLAGGRSIALPQAGEARPGVLHVLPIRRQARDVFAQAAWLVVVTQLGATAAPSASILSGLFDLTPAEARVTRQLIEGAAVNEIAESSGLSESTIRNQLRSIFAKTGASRQSELVLMCGGLGMPRT